MRKISLAVAALFMGVSLNAATVATLNGKNISDTELNEAFAPVLGGQDFKKLNTEQKRQLIDQYAMNMLVVEEAKKQNIEKDPEYNKLLERAKEGILINLYQKKIYQTIKIDEAKIKAAYEQNKANLVRPASVVARHILVTSENEAKDIINQLKGLKNQALTDKFSELARVKSIDKASGANGGMLGRFGTGQMVKEFENAAFSLKNGELSKSPVKTQFGYHIILKESSQPKEQIKYEEAKNNIENELKFQETQRIMNQKIQDIMKAAKVEYK